MGGKHKQAQRTKNNARPSSSGRSAELLGNSISQFTGFSTIKDACFTLPTLTLAMTDDTDSMIDSNFQLVLKKMSKKDSTTKLKALQEFTDLVKSSDQETIKNADHKVREATHSSHHQVVLKAKRNLAPYLKQLAGAWFTSQYDTYAPAASAATRSFEDAFPPNKIQEAIIYCQEEILNYIYDNLVVQTVQSLNNTLKGTTEDAEAKYERVVISSLHGYSLYINKVSSENIEKAEDINRKIVSSGKFWKFSKSKVVPIRTAFFGTLKTICQKAPFLLKSETEHIVSAIFQNLDETEPTVLPNIWEAVLLCVTTFEVRFFLKQRSTISSRSESSAVSITLIECLQYIIMKNQANIPLCEKLIKTELIPIIEWCLNECPDSYKQLYNQVAGLVQYWHRNRNHQDVHNYLRYLEYFWTNLDSLFQGLLMNVERSFEKNAASDLAVRQIELLISLKHTIKPRKQMKVKFETEPLESGDLNTSGSMMKSDKCDESYQLSLNVLVFKLCKSYVNFINSKQSRELLEHLYALILEFENKDFFVSLSKMVMGDGEEQGKLIHIYEKLLYKWLKSSYLCTKSVIDMIFILFKYLDDSEKLNILETFTKLQSEQCGWCVTRALSYPYNSDPVIQQWLSNAKVDEYLISIAEKELILDESTPESSILLKQAFTEHKDEELFISKNAVIQIVNIISNCLLNPSDHPVTLDSCASLAAYISSVLYTENLKLRYGTELLLALFKLSCNTRLDTETISQDTLWEVNTAWQDVVGILCCSLETEELKSLANQFAEIIEEEFLINDAKIFKSEEIVDKIVNFIRVIKKNNGFVIFKLLELFLERNFVPKWRSELTNLCVCAEYSRGSLSSLYSPVDSGIISVEDETILKYFKWLGLVIDVFLTPIEAVENYEDDEDEVLHEESPLKEVHTMIDASDDIYKVMLNLLYDVTLANTIKDNFKTIKSYSNLVEISESFIEKLKILMTHIDCKSHVERELMERITKDSWLWAKVVHFLSAEVAKEDLTHVYGDYLNKDEFQEEICQGRVHLTQAFAETLSFDDVLYNACLSERVVTLRSLIHREDIAADIAGTFKLIDAFKIKCGKDLYNLDLSNWERTETLIEIIRLCSAVIRNNKVQSLSQEHWDFSVISLASWCTKLPELRVNYQKIQVSAFISAVAELFTNVESYLNDLEQHMPEHKYILEWRAVFAQDVHTELIATWLYLSEKLLEQYKQNPARITQLPFLQQFGSCISSLKNEYLFKKTDDRSPKWSKLLKTCCSLLTNPLHSLQLWGYHMLISLITGLIEIDSSTISCSKPKKELVLKEFKDLMVQTQDIVHTMLIDFRLGENSCRVEPYTDSYTYTFAYLLLWDVILSMCEKASTELRYQYADWLRNEDFLNNLLNNIFKLIPAEVLHYNDIRIKPFDEWFVKKFQLLLTDPINSNKIERMACWVYANAVTQLPALVRQWWSSIETRVNQVVDRVTSAYVSPQLCAQELADVATHENKFKNMVIKIHPSVREVVAIYTVDEAQMDLVITLPTNYPLGGPDVQCNRQIGGTTHKQWLMQFKMCVLHQNGRIWDGLSLWNNNLDKKFDGVEECYICFAVLHPGTYQLPKLSCQTCRKKFHSACLVIFFCKHYKWFSTSNKSTCPICRNLF
ncbi:zinc finger protein [Holotrichia oblita]|uniref:Zinc finger protein n=1 Tax=Holotrichia oblita TaxID=644536 RepID=A0ACB9SUT1_HOLOL|nr:zinc finger protein [Holotrichia oblita]